MRTFFKVILFLTLSFCFSACKDDEKATNDSSLVEGTISGSLLSGNDSVICYLQNEEIVIGKSSVDVNGKFSIKLSVPDSKYLSLISAANGITLSDPNTKLVSVDFKYKNENSSYYLFKLNTAISMTKIVGSSQNVFLFSDHSCSFIGQSSQKEDDNTTFYQKYNLLLDQGWNEINMKLTAQTVDSYTMEFTKDTPSGMQWYYTQK